MDRPAHPEVTIVVAGYTLSDHLAHYLFRPRPGLGINIQ